ncbi:bacteriorhodopsin [Kineococcus rubinsiae]|uniref:bacteriorhodopsin n=1 Tax=Kineococcus rubinsiae TaxID=2609562 RepID=UPI001431913D|nr:bacteriorhodopsin [Kineococcus rubinsiae]NIZ90386.1 rhodopsin [Kineococcus rubinsiae]
MLAVAATRPELVTLSPSAHDLIQYSMVVAGLALFAHFVRTWNSTSEVGVRYRPAVLASLSITGVAFLAYVYLVVKFDQGYILTDGRYLPNAEALNTLVPRYMDWSVTVPLLMIEFLAVSAIAGAAARSRRFTLMTAAFLMILTGFIGATVQGDGTSQTALLVWGIVSSVFYLALYVLLINVLRQSKASMSARAYATYRNAGILLLSVWGWYPIAYAIHNWASGQWWTVTIQVGFSFADIAAKVGFGALIHKVAKLRTAEDVHAGEQTHPEEVWISSVKMSDGVQPLLKGVILANEAQGGGRLQRASTTTTTAERERNLRDITGATMTPPTASDTPRAFPEKPPHS